MNVRTWIGILSAGTVVLAAACENDWQPTLQVVPADAGGDAVAGAAGAGGGSAGEPAVAGKGGTAGANEGGAGSDPQPNECTPNKKYACTGQNDCEGTRVCATDGKSYGRCVCSVDPPSEGGAGGGTSVGCPPNTWRECACTSGGQGFQQCADDGQSFSPCERCESSDPDEPNDGDGDGWTDTFDNCPDAWNPFQEDTDDDGDGNACDATPNGNTPPPGDGDGDGSPTGTDCNDSRSDVFPGAPELCDGLNNDCDGETDEGCSPPPQNGYVVIRYTYVTQGSAEWAGLSFYHQVNNGQAIPLRLAPYKPAMGGTPYLDQHAWGIAWDGMGADCSVKNSSSLTCVLHVPAGLRVRLNVHSTRASAGSGLWACEGDGSMYGAITVQDGRGSAVPLSAPQPHPADIAVPCVFEYTAPSQ